MKLFRNAYLWLAGSFTTDMKAILVHNGVIESIMHEPVSSVPSYAQVIDLEGAYLYPGFIDTHTHSFEGGLYSLGVDLSNVSCIDEVLARLHEQYKNNDDIIFAWQFDEQSIREQRFPSMNELDSVVPDKPLVLRRIDGHSCVLNSYARKQLSGLDPVSEILRAQDNDIAVHHFHKMLKPDAILNAYNRAAEIAVRGGFTGIHTMVGDAMQSIGHYSLLSQHISSFKVTYTLYPQSFNLKAALDAGARRIGGCILADGSIGSHTAALFQPYYGTDNSGSLYHDDSFWRKFIGDAHKHNLQVGVHCIGDKAIKQINVVYQQLADSTGKDLRHQLIHCELTDDALVSDISKSGAVPVMQPNFDFLWGGDNGFYSKQLGVARSSNMNRLASLTRSGVKVCGSSDWYITPLDAVQSIRAAMQHHNVNERLSHAQAVDIYTRNAAWLSHEENSRGTISEGYNADFCILSSPIDNFMLKPSVKMVVKQGSTVYETD